MLVCNGPRIDRYAALENGELAAEHLVSFVNECIPRLVRKETFDARLSVVRVDESQVVFTDGTHTIVARFADALCFSHGVFRVRGESIAPLEVGDVMDLHALGYAHARHKRMQAQLEFFPTCLVTSYVRYLGRDVPGERVSALIEQASRDQTTAGTAGPKVHTLPAHAVTRKQRTTLRMSLAARSTFCSAAARASREGHVAALALAMQTKLFLVFADDDMLGHVADMLIPRVLSLVMRTNKTIMTRLVQYYMPKDLLYERLTPEMLVLPRLAMPFGLSRLRRDMVFYNLRRGLVRKQLRVSLGAATCGLALYFAQSVSRVFSIERVYGAFLADNLTVCRCMTPREPCDVRRMSWRWADGKQEVRCALCVVTRERQRWLWGLEAEGCDMATADGGRICTHRRVQLGMWHRFLFREDKTIWTQIDNVRRSMNIMATAALNDSETFPSYRVNYVQDGSAKREHRLPRVERLTLANGSEQHLDLPGCRATLRKLHIMFPMTPGVLLKLHGECMSAVRGIWAAYQETKMARDEAEETMHVGFFMPELLAEAPRLRVVLQICGNLMHGVRVIYVQHGADDGTSECVIHLDDDFVSFSAHDGRNEMMFSTDCQSFMRILEQALATQAMDDDYQRVCEVSREADSLRIWQGDGAANVLANYVIAFSMHEVQDVAHVCFLDVLHINEPYSSVLYEMRAYDIEVLDTKMPYTSLDEEPDAMRRTNCISCNTLVAEMRLLTEALLDDEDLLRRQEQRRVEDMESEDKVFEDDDGDGPQDEVHTPQTPSVVEGAESDGTVVYSS